MIFDILVTLFLVLLNGFFVAAEFAIVKVRASQIELRARTGSVLARIARSMLLHLDGYLSATQLGITLASLGLGWIGEKVVSQVVIEAMHAAGVNLPEETAHQISFPIAFSIITVLHIVLGELAPKSLALQRSEAVTLAVSLPLRGFYLLFKPFIWLLNSLANVLLRSVGITHTGEHDLHSPEEIRYLIEESQRGGAIEHDEHSLIENVFEFQQTEVRQIMVPRRLISGLELTIKSEAMLDRVMDEGYSRMPVYSGTLDAIVGIIYTKDLISVMRYGNLILMQDILREPVFVQEDVLISDVLRRMKKEQFHMAIVVDEFGGTAGLITLEDIIEEIVGEIKDEYDEEATPVEENTSTQEFTVKATSTIADLNEYLPVPLPQNEDLETLGGLISSEAGRIPDIGESFVVGQYVATILTGSRRLIESVKLVLQPYPDDQI